METNGYCPEKFISTFKFPGISDAHQVADFTSIILSGRNSRKPSFSS